MDRGISCVGPVGRGRRASACVEGPVRGRGPRSTDETPDARFGVAPRGLRTIADSGLAAGGQRAGPRVGTPSPATRRPGGGRRDADPDGGAGGAVVLARCRGPERVTP